MPEPLGATGAEPVLPAPTGSGDGSQSPEAGDPGSAWPGWRLGLSPRATVVVGVLLAIGLVGGLLLVLRSRPTLLATAVATDRAEPSVASGSDATAGTGLSWATPTPTPPGPLVVHVAGLVRHPGVVTLTPGARVVDALTAAGGPGPGADLGSVNLARLLVDGEQIRVLDTGEPAPPGSSGPADRVLSLNSATAAELESLPGVGPVLAGRILDWRMRHGRFSSVEELREVSGIGEKLFATLAPLVRV